MYDINKLLTYYNNQVLICKWSRVIHNYKFNNYINKLKLEYILLKI